MCLFLAGASLATRWAEALFPSLPLLPLPLPCLATGWASLLCRCCPCFPCRCLALLDAELLRDGLRGLFLALLADGLLRAGGRAGQHLNKGNAISLPKGDCAACCALLADVLLRAGGRDGQRFGKGNQISLPKDDCAACCALLAWASGASLAESATSDFPLASPVVLAPCSASGAACTSSTEDEEDEEDDEHVPP